MRGAGWYTHDSQKLFNATAVLNNFNLIIANKCFDNRIHPVTLQPAFTRASLCILLASFMLPEAEELLFWWVCFRRYTVIDCSISAYSSILPFSFLNSFFIVRDEVLPLEIRILKINRVIREIFSFQNTIHLIPQDLEIELSESIRNATNLHLDYG